MACSCDGTVQLLQMHKLSMFCSDAWFQCCVEDCCGYGAPVRLCAVLCVVAGLTAHLLRTGPQQHHNTRWWGPMLLHFCTELLPHSCIWGSCSFVVW